ncbi:MAG: type II toxin-antitoxin system HipA family toxin, partial [Acidobacteriota bacterium]
LMDRSGRWFLSPAYDVTYSYNPDGAWTASHQMSMNGKRDGFTLDDFKACARIASMKRGRERAILDEVRKAARRWPEFAAAAGVESETAERIRRTLRLDEF